MVADHTTYNCEEYADLSNERQYEIVLTIHKVLQ